MENINFSISDYHIHSPYCGHAHGKIIEYVESAIQKGMKEMCFTDHLGRYYITKSQKKRYWDWGMDKSELTLYLAELEEIRNLYKNHITIRIGLEIDYIEGAEDLLMPLIDSYPFDFLLGSIHCLPTFGWKHIAKYSKENMGQIFEEYFRIAKAAISSGIFSSLAHLDFIWRYAKWPEEKTTKIFKNIEEVVQTASSQNTAIEINSNGYLWSQIYTIKGGDPFTILLENIQKYHTPVTIGSDAHKPEFVGKVFNEMAFMLKSKGVSEYYVFNKMRKTARKIP